MKTGRQNIYYRSKEEELLQKLDKKLELEQLLKLFEYFPHDYKKLYKTLSEKKTKITSLVLSNKNYNLLFPKSGKTDFTKFGSSLLHIMIYNFCELQQLENGWTQEPSSDDLTESACFVRIMLARSMIQNIFNSSSGCGIFIKDYQKVFSYIRNTLFQLGNDKEEIQPYMNYEKYGVIPPVSNFHGRENNLQQIHSKFNQINIDQKLGFVLTGEKGIGKTEIIRKYCQQFEQYYDGNILWFDASTNYSLSSGFRQLALKLGLPVKNELNNVLSTKTLWSSISWYFENVKVLFVFDNVQSSYQIMKYLSTAFDNHYVIVISKCEFPRNKFLQYTLNPMSLDEANAFIKKGIHIASNPNGQVRLIETLSNVLNKHPFAMALAIAYMKETNTKIELYIEFLKNTIKAEQQNAAEVIPSPTFCTVLVTFNYITQLGENEVIKYILNLLSFLNGTYISSSFLQQLLSMKFKGNNFEVKDMLRMLHRLLLIQYHNDSNSNEIIAISHQLQEIIKHNPTNVLAVKRLAFGDVMKYLLQNLLQDNLFSNFFDDFISECLLHFLHIFKSKEFCDHFMQVCVGNQTALLGTFSENGHTRDFLEVLWEVENHLLVDKNSEISFITKMNIAKAYHLLGGIDEALKEYQHIHQDIVKVFSDFGSIAVECQYSIARCLYKQSHYSHAFEICQKLRYSILTSNILEPLKLQIEFLQLKCSIKQRNIQDILGKLKEFEKTLGDNEHIIGNKVKMHIAKCMYLEGKFQESIEIYQNVEKQQETMTNGNSQNQIIKTKKLLATCYFETDQIEEALERSKEMVILQTFSLGEYHGDTLRTKFFIARCFQKLGKFETAKKIYRMVEYFQKLFVVYPSEDLVNTKEQFASCLYEMGHFNQALLKYKETEQIQVELFGHFDSEVLKTKHSIAVCLHSHGKLQEAMNLYQQILTTQTKLLGRSNIETLRTELNLCVSLLDGGQENAALVRLLKLEKAQIDSLEYYHPDLITTQHNIAICLHKKKLFQFAIQKYIKLEESLENIIGKIDLKVVKVKHDLAVCLHENDQLSDAIKKYDEVFALQMEMLGDSHPDVFATRYNIAVCYHDNKNLRIAAIELEDIEKHQAKALGDDHPDVKLTRASLSICKKEAEFLGDDLSCTIL